LGENIGDIGACVAAMTAHAEQLWTETESLIASFSEEAENLMSGYAPIETGNLREEIKSKMRSAGVMTAVVETSIGDAPHPINGVPASYYGRLQNDGFTNKRSKQYVVGKYFMEDGSLESFEALLPMLAGVW
jgi:hypothetical protein